MSRGSGEPPRGEPAVPERRRSLRRNLTTTFILVALLAVLLLGALQFVQARDLLNNSVTDQLRSQQATKARAIRDGLDQLQETVVLIARSQTTVDSILEFSQAFEGLLGQPDLLDAGQAAELEQHYGSAVAAIEAAGLEAPSIEDLVPRTAAGRYLQYHYVVDNPSAASERRQMVTAEGDTSAYGEVHSGRHPRLAELSTQLGIGDLLLVDPAGNVVYSTDKWLDFATNAHDGPWQESGVGETVQTRLAAAAVGDAVLNDVVLYLPSGGRPTLFAAAAVRDEARTVGAVLVQIPSAAIDALVTDGGDYEGLGETGEVYVVGADRLMRSNSRLWLEDPDSYLEALADEGFNAGLSEAIGAFETTVVLQPVNTKAVAAAFEDRLFEGRSSNYLGRKSLTVAGPVGDDQLDWVVVADLAAGEAGRPLRSYAVRIGVVAAILIPLIALVASFLADRMIRPVRPVVEAAAKVAAGHLETVAPDLGGNEFGDVARRLNTLTADLRAQEQTLAREEKEIRDMLLSTLPPRLVEQLRSGEQHLKDLVDSATVVALSVRGVLEEAGIDPESAVELDARLSSEIEAVADRRGVERVRSSSNQHLFAAGLDTPEPAVATAAGFALEAVHAVGQIAEELGVELSYQAGMSAGEVVAGVLRVDQLTYGLFGDPPRTALALSSFAAPDQILLDEETATSLGAEWDMRPAEGLVDLRGESVSARLLVGGPIEVTMPEDGS